MSIQIANTTKKIADNQSAQQIIDYLCIAIRDSQKDFPKLRKMFLKKTDEETLKAIYQYTQDNFTYYKEPPDNQKVRTAARVMHDRKVDCKGYSTFILSCCAACDIPAKFRLASYNYFDTTPTHVYVVAIPDGEEIVLDGTMKSYDHEHPYKHITNVKPKIRPMALNYLQGVPEYGIYGKAERQARRKKRSDKRDTKRAEKGKETKEQKKARREAKKSERGTLVARIAAAPARAAFLAVVRMNFLKTADKLAAAYKKDVNKIAQFWAKFGGKLPDLKSTIEKGSKKALSEQASKGMGSVSLTAALATATPIMIAVSSLIKQLGLFEGKEDEMAFDEEIENGIDFLEDDPSITKEFVDAPSDGEVFAYSRTGVRPKTASRSAGDESTEEGSSMMMPILIGGGLLAAYLFTRKK